MKKIAKFLIPIIVVACNDTSTKTPEKLVETADNLYFSEPALYKSHLENELKAFYTTEKKIQTAHYSNEESMSDQKSAEPQEKASVNKSAAHPESEGDKSCEQVYKDCMAEEGSSEDYCKNMEKICIDSKISTLKILETTSKGIRKPPKPDPCPQGNCFPIGILIEEGCTKCRITIFDIETGEEVAHSTGEMIGLPVEGYVGMPIEITKYFEGNVLVKVEKIDINGRMTMYQTEYGHRKPVESPLN